MKRSLLLLTANWRAKLGCLLLAVMVWLLLR